MTRQGLTPDYVASPLGIRQLVKQFRTMQLYMVNSVTGDGEFGGLSMNDDDCFIISSIEDDYKVMYEEAVLRIELLQDRGIQISNPNTFRTIDDWRLRCKKDDLPTYKSRRFFIAELYGSVLRRLEDALVKQKATDSSHEEFIRDLIKRFAPSGDVKAYVAQFPPSIVDSLARFSAEYIPSETAFIMMRFSKTNRHTQITDAIKSTLKDLGITGLRADDVPFHDDLLPNVETYMHGCGIGIAVLERIETNDINPNVSLEIGYMLGLGKPVCLLKDSTLPVLQADLAGKLYSVFSLEDIQRSIQRELTAWIVGKGLGRSSI